MTDDVFELDQNLINKMALDFYDYYDKTMRENNFLTEDETFAIEDMGHVMVHMNEAFKTFDNNMKIVCRKFIKEALDTDGMTPQ